MAKKKIESSFLNMVVTLLVVTGVASLSLGAIYNMTKEPIAAARKAKLETAIGQVLPQFDNTEKKEVMPADGKDPLIFYTATKDGENVGTAVETYTDKGFGGRVKIIVGFLPDGTIFNTAVLDHKETPGLGDKMDKSKSAWSDQFNTKNPKSYALKVTKDGGDVDAITAATISSRAFCDAVTRAWETIKNEGGIK